MTKYRYELISPNYQRNSARTTERSLKFSLCFIIFFTVVIYKRQNRTIIPNYGFKLTNQSDNFNITKWKTTSAYFINNSMNDNISLLSKEFLSKYFVFTSHCKMPYIDAFSPEAKKVFHRQKVDNCSKSTETLINVFFSDNLKQYVLHRNEENISKKYPNSSESFSCCYRDIVRSGSGAKADNDFKILPCVNFHQDFVVPQHIQYVIVDCIVKPSDKVIYEDAFAFVQRNETKSPASNGTVTKRKPSVLLIGIDSLSRMNFRRNMPLTFEYLQKKYWFELFGYNKVGDNTFPNLMPLLTGLNETNAYKQCQPKTPGGLDKCKIMWNYYKQYGYYTGYGEDSSWMSTFNYLKKGFMKQPTDYYLRPLLLALDKHIKRKTKEAGLAFCLGRKQYGEYVYDYAIEFANRFYDEPVFGLFWTNSFSHNNYQTPSKMDTKMLEYFKNFELNGVMENTIIIFFSDHGCRWGKLLHLSDGFFEERLPMFFLSLPIWFQNQHPEIVKAMHINQHRLTSPYDIYKTLHHILQMHEPNAKMPACPDCGNAQSIFLEIPANRTCQDAGISEHWCTCIPYQKLSTNNDTVKKITNLIVSEMNNYLLGKNFSSQCSLLQLKSIEKAELKMDEEETPKQTYRLKYQTNPKAASFQATAIYNTINAALTVDVESISRLNTYSNDSECILDKKAKLYCICKN